MWGEMLGGVMNIPLRASVRGDEGRAATRLGNARVDGLARGTHMWDLVSLPCEYVVSS